jgi:hypothetical protein
MPCPRPVHSSAFIAPAPVPAKRKAFAASRIFVQAAPPPCVAPRLSSALSVSYRHIPLEFLVLFGLDCENLFKTPLRRGGKGEGREGGGRQGVSLVRIAPLAALAPGGVLTQT